MSESKYNKVYVKSFQEAADLLNNNPDLFAEITAFSGNFLVFIGRNDRLTVRSTKNIRHWFDSVVKSGEITKNDVESLVYDVDSLG